LTFEPKRLHFKMRISDEKSKMETIGGCMRRLLSILVVLTLLASMSQTIQITNAIDYSLVYDFVANAGEAKWYGGFGDLPFPGKTSDRVGYALWRTNEFMEDGKQYERILQVHPDVKENGYIRGVFPIQTIPEKARLNLVLGYLRGASETQGVTFTVNFQAGRGLPIQLYKTFKKYTQRLVSETVDLTNYSGKTGNIILLVSAEKPNPVDLSAWVSVTLEKEKPEEALPDLIISNIRVDQGKIYYTLKNTGAGRTPNLRRGQSIKNSLSLDRREIATDLVTKGLEPGEELESFFPDFVLSESDKEQVFIVCADSISTITESNERNNCSEKRVSPKPPKPPEEEEPLKFLRLPQVSGITQTSARFTWVTNNDSTSSVLYDVKFRTFGLKFIETKLKKIHDVTLGNLKPGTLYEYYVECADAKGNTIKSPNGFFKTLPEPLNTKPSLRFTLPDKLMNRVTILPTLTEGKSFARLNLFVDNRIVFTNYAMPFTLELDTKKYANGVHEFKLQGIDMNGKPYVEVKEGLIANTDLKLNQGPVITILAPVSNTDFPNSTAVIPLKATIDHKQNYGIHHLEIFIDGSLIYTAKPKKSTGLWATKDELPKTFNYDIPISYFAEGDHKVELKAFDSENLDNYVVTKIKTHTPSWYKPVLVLTYKTSLEALHHTSYKVDFMITNNGNLPAKDITLQITQDFLPGFILSNANQGAVVTLYSDYQVLEFHLSELDFQNGKNVFHLYFDLTPVLISPVNWSVDDYVIMKECSLIYNWDGNPKVPNWENWDMANHVSNDAFWMAKSADYLIISNIKTLLSNSPPNKSNVNDLLMAMAQLASKKKGVIGLMNGMWLSPESVKQKILAWGDNLAPDWFNSGYLLIVGETEIVPSFTRYFSGSNSTVPTTDYPYADTAGNEMYPELTIGRIIGDSAASLAKPIRASIDVVTGDAVFRRNHHQNSNAYTLSGTGDGEATFWDSAYWVGETLKQEFYYVGQGSGRAIINEGVPLYKRLRQRTPGLSVLFYRNHGGAYCWCDGDVSATVDGSSPAYVGYITFNNSRPFIFACCCDSGKYEGIYGIANAFMEKAGAYIGSTGLSDRASNNYNALQFYKNWVNQPQKSLGNAFKEIRIFAFYNAVWNAEYQFYGDPKFGIETP